MFILNVLPALVSLDSHEAAKLGGGGSIHRLKNQNDGCLQNEPFVDLVHFMTKKK